MCNLVPGCRQFNFKFSLNFKWFHQVVPSNVFQPNASGESRKTEHGGCRALQGARQEQDRRRAMAHTKHFNPGHHRTARPWYLHEPNAVRELPKAQAPKALRGCVGTLPNGYHKAAPLPRVNPYLSRVKPRPLEPITCSRHSQPIATAATAITRIARVSLTSNGTWPMAMAA